MKNRSRISNFICIVTVVAAIAATTFCACGKKTASEPADGVSLVASDNPLYEISPGSVTCERGKEAKFIVETVPGAMITGVDTTDGQEITYLGMSAGGSRRYLVRVFDVSHTQIVEAVTKRITVGINYHGGEGALMICDSNVEAAGTDSVSVEKPLCHLGINTARADELFERPGYTLIGWSTKTVSGDTPEDFVSCGSRIPVSENGEAVSDLYAVWAKWTDESLFSYEESGDGVMITGSTISDFGDELVIPASLSGKPVYGIRKDAFTGIRTKRLILPTGLLKVEERAFSEVDIGTVIIPDDIGDLSARAFSEVDIETVRMVAASPRVYSGSYFNCFADKMAALEASEGDRKLVLFSGSSTRFGYDCKAIEQAYSDLEVVNMGVFAYTNALPQLRLIEGHMGEGDTLLLSPEFDAAQSQFCIRDVLEWQIFAMCEGDYDILADLDMRQYSGVCQALSGYLSGRKGMKECDDSISVFGLDEDGNTSDSPVYNDRGDYTLYRPDAEDDTPIYDLPVDYRASAFPYESYIRPFNEICTELGDRGIRVLFTYAPRNIDALSEESTIEARAELDDYLRSDLVIPVISDIEESLYPGRYLYGTDNHLSTEGVRIRTERIIESLAVYLPSP